MGQSQALAREKKEIDDYVADRKKRNWAYNWTQDPGFVERLTNWNKAMGLPPPKLTYEAPPVEEESEAAQRARIESMKWLEEAVRRNAHKVPQLSAPPKTWPSAPPQPREPCNCKCEKATTATADWS